MTNDTNKKTAKELFDIPGCGHIRCYAEAMACAMENIRDSAREHPELYDTRPSTMRGLAEEWAREYLEDSTVTCLGRNQ